MATIPSPSTQVTAAVVASALLNNHRDSLQFVLGSTMTGGGGRRPLAILRQAVSQNIPTGAWTALTYDTVDADYDGSHSLITNTSRFTAVTAGWHHVDAAYGTATNATGRRLVAIRKNLTGTANPTGPRNDAASAANLQVFQCSGKVYLAVGDWIEVVAFQDTGGGLATAVSSVDVQSIFQVFWISN